MRRSRDFGRGRERDTPTNSYEGCPALESGPHAFTAMHSARQMPTGHSTRHLVVKPQLATYKIIINYCICRGIGHFGPVHFSTGYFGLVHFGPGHFGPVHFSSGYFGPVHFGPGYFGPGHFGPATLWPRDVLAPGHFSLVTL